MVITSIPNHPAPMYVSAPMHAVPSKLVRDTIYLPSSVAARLLGPAAHTEPSLAPRPAARETSRG